MGSMVSRLPSVASPAAVLHTEAVARANGRDSDAATGEACRDRFPEVPLRASKRPFGAIRRRRRPGVAGQAVPDSRDVRARTARVAGLLRVTIVRPTNCSFFSSEI